MADWDTDDRRQGFGRADYGRGDYGRPGGPRAGFGRGQQGGSYRERAPAWEGRGQGDEDDRATGWRSGGSGYGSRGRQPDTRGGDRQREGEERGFFDRASDEVRSWFGDDDAERRRRRDESGDADFGRYRDQQYAGGYDQDDGPDSGWRWQRSPEDRSSPDNRVGFSASRGATLRGSQHGAGRDQGFGSRGYGEDYDLGRGRSQRDDFGQSNYDDDVRSGRAGRSEGGSNRRFGGSHWDEHYQNWRAQQLEALDRDYEEFRRQRHEDFSREFSSWRQSRAQSQPQPGSSSSASASGATSSPGASAAAASPAGGANVSAIREHMEVVGADGKHVGTVDKVDGDHIKLTKSDQDAHGKHHLVPLDWVASVDRQVRLSKSSQEVEKEWRELREGGQGAG